MEQHTFLSGLQLTYQPKFELNGICAWARTGISEGHNRSGHPLQTNRTVTAKCCPYVRLAANVSKHSSTLQHFARLPLCFKAATN